MAGVVVDVDQRHRGQAVTGALQRFGQGGGVPGVVHDRLGGGVGQQVDQFVGDVTVVDVERRDPGVEGPEHAFQVFVAVSQVQREVALTRFMGGQRGTFPAHTQSALVQRPRQPTGSVLNLLIGESPVTEDDAVPVRNGGRHC